VSDGECCVNSSGGVGILGSFGDVLKRRVQTDRWHRITMAVTCAPAGNKGEFKTWVEDASMASLQHEMLVEGERFTIDPDGLFLFSSGKQEMMPGKLLVRSIRVDQSMYTAENVKAARARDKIVSMYAGKRVAPICSMLHHRTACCNHSTSTAWRAAALHVAAPHDMLQRRFEEERRREVDEQRKGLSLAPLYPKPRPMWQVTAVPKTSGVNAVKYPS
jgi:hypothetical protein